MTGNFNSRPFILIIGGLIYIALALFGFRALLGGDIIRFGFILCLPLVLVFNSLRRYWAAFLLGSLSLWTLGSFQMPVIGSLGLSGVMLLLVAGFLVLDVAMRKPRIFIYWRGYYTLFVLSVALIAARVIYDRPGMANLGSEQGGLNVAVNYIMSFAGFGLGYFAALYQKSWKATFRLLVLSSIVFYLIGDIWLSRGVVSDGSGEMSVYGLSYTRSLYFLFTALIILSLRAKTFRLFGPVAFAVVIALLLVLGGISAVRSTVFQTGAMIATAGLLYRRFATGMLIYVGLAVAALGSIVAVIPYDDLPSNIKRPLSVFLMDKNDTSAAYGAKDEFRENLWNYATKQITLNPIFGRGWAFDLSDLLTSMNMDNVTPEEGQLVMTGSFHNSFLTIAVNSGVPTAAICVLAFLSGGFSLFRYARKETDPELKESIAFMLIYCSSIIIMAYLNGSTYEIRGLAVALGIASAFRDVAERKRADQRRAAAVPSVEGGALPQQA